MRHVRTGKKIKISRNYLNILLVFSFLLSLLTFINIPSAYAKTEGISSNTATPPITSVGSNTLWYFGEGHVNNSFDEYLSLENPNSTDAHADIHYIFSNTSLDATQNLTVKSHTRQTVNVTAYLNQTLNIVASDVSMVVHSDVGIVAERPMYFDYMNSIPGGSDVIGANSLATTYYFADVESTQGYTTYLTIMNPPVLSPGVGGSGQAAHVTATFYSNGKSVGTASVTAQPGQRQTILVNSFLPDNTTAIAMVTSDQPVMVERPMYFISDNFATYTQGWVSGGTDVIGTTNPGTSAYLAEGHTGDCFEEQLVLANPANTNVTVNVKFLTPSGVQGPFSYLLIPFSQQLVVVNDVLQNGDNSVVATANLPFLITRQMYFRKDCNLPGGTEASGATSLGNTFGFGEGHVGDSFSEYITLQNPNNVDIIVAMNIYETSPQGQNSVLQQWVPVPANTRQTIWVNGIVNVPPNTLGGTDISIVGQAFQASDTSMTLPILVERPMYFNYQGQDTGGTVAIGYM